MLQYLYHFSAALNQIANVRLSTDGSGLEWDAPSNADSAGCTIERYTISVNGDAYNSSTTSVSFSVFDPQPDTCDSSLSITVTASVRTLSLVGSSVSDAFNPTSGKCVYVAELNQICIMTFLSIII